MTTFFNTPEAVVHHGNCLDVLKEMPDNSIDSIVTDPPYGLGNTDPDYILSALQMWIGGDREHIPAGKGFMGKQWDSFVPPPAVWDECFRVLKPGGHILVFAGSRTQDLMGLSIRMAGFEIRDGLGWIYASGFPKSLNVSKALDKKAGAERTVLGRNPNSRENATKDNTLYESGTVGKTDFITAPATDEAIKWDGWGTALKPGLEPILMARKPLEGTVVENVLKYGTGAINIDGSRLGNEGGEDFSGLKGRPIQKLATRREGETDEEYNSRVLESPSQQEALDKLQNLGRWPSNVLFDESQTDELEKQMPGASKFYFVAKASKRDRNEGLEGLPVKGKIFNGKNPESAGKAEGSVEDKFTTKPSANHHPTVKPFELMRYLVKLVTPVDGTVLDPFTGSGSTGKAAIADGYKFVGIEMTDEYLPIIKGRLEHAIKEKNSKLV